MNVDMHCSLLEFLESSKGRDSKATKERCRRPKGLGFWWKENGCRAQEAFIDEQIGFVKQSTCNLQNESLTKNAFRKEVIEYLNAAADREAGIDKFLREKEDECNRWMVDGDDQTEKYVLDGEAFQMENGLRLWDFFYLDKIKSMDELNTSSPEVQNLIAASFQDKQATGSVANRNLFKSLLNHAKHHVQHVIVGILSLRSRCEIWFDHYRGL